MKKHVVDYGKGWGIHATDDFVDFPKNDESGIAVTLWEHQIPVERHRHHFYELALITKGVCVHDYRGVQTSLFPGDVFFIEPDEYHGYMDNSNLELINCQFLPEILTQGSIAGSGLALDGGSFVQREDWKALVKDLFDEEESAETPENSLSQQAKLNRQGIIHLSAGERQELDGWLNRILEEQEYRQVGYEQAKFACLQMILIFFRRLQSRQKTLRNQLLDPRKEAIDRSIAYIESHLSEKISVEKLAADAHWSSRHYRVVFKEITGLTPLEYINRVRIIKSLEYMELNKSSIAEAAASVGIIDTNYYSRLFKKNLGYAPRYFKSVEK